MLLFSIVSGASETYNAVNGTKYLERKVKRMEAQDQNQDPIRIDEYRRGRIPRNKAMQTISLVMNGDEDSINIQAARDSIARGKLTTIDLSDIASRLPDKRGRKIALKRLGRSWWRRSSNAIMSILGYGRAEDKQQVLDLVTLQENWAKSIKCPISVGVFTAMILGLWDWIGTVPVFHYIPFTNVQPPFPVSYWWLILSLPLITFVLVRALVSVRDDKGVYDQVYRRLELTRTNRIKESLASRASLFVIACIIGVVFGFFACIFLPFHWLTNVFWTFIAIYLIIETVVTRVYGLYKKETENLLALVCVSVFLSLFVNPMAGIIYPITVLALYSTCCVVVNIGYLIYDNLLTPIGKGVAYVDAFVIKNTRNFFKRFIEWHSKWSWF